MSTNDLKKPILFPVKFPKQLEDWKKEQKEQGKPGTNYEFAKQVGVPSYYVTDWKTGRNGIPYTYIDKICEVFGVSKKVYYPITHREKIENSTEFITKVGKDNVQYATQEGLNLKFVEALSKIVEFDEKFPVYAPINNIKGNSIQGYTFSRSKPGNSAQIDHDLQFLQVQQDGKTITMSRGDLMYLKEVQDEIADYVKYLFYKRKLEMVKEVEQFNEDLTDDDFDENGHVKPEFVLKHDRFAIAFEDVNSNQKEGE